MDCKAAPLKNCAEEDGVGLVRDFRQFCFVSTQFPISKSSIILNIFETEQLQIGNWVETSKTKLSCLVANCVYTADTDKTIDDGFVLSMSEV